MAKTYTLNVAGLTRELTICKVNSENSLPAKHNSSEPYLKIYIIPLYDARPAEPAAAEHRKGA